VNYKEAAIIFFLQYPEDAPKKYIHIIRKEKTVLKLYYSMFMVPCIIIYSMK